MKNEFLRHTVATIHYRFNKAVRNAEDSFGDFSLGKGSRSPNEIIHHMYAVLNATSLFIKDEKIKKEKIGITNTSQEIIRFRLELKNLDALLSKKELSMNYSKKLLQGPLADVLTHIGQLSMLQRMYGNPIEGEDFSAADINPDYS
jgi:hypothetical protein